MRVIILDFPFPPSSNKIRGSFFNKKNGRMAHYDTASYKAYKKECGDWALVNFKELRHIRGIFKKLIQDQKTMLMVSTFFVFKHSNIWTADGKMQEMDASNRIKATHDLLSGCLEIDDRYFNIKNAEKVWALDHERERVVIVLTAEPIRSLDQLRADILPSKDVPEAKTN